MGGYDHTLPRYDLFAMFEVGKIRKIRLYQAVIFAKKNPESAEFTNKKHGKPTLHFLIAKHVLEMSMKLKYHVLKRSNTLI